MFIFKCHILPPSQETGLINLQHTLNFILPLIIFFLQCVMYFGSFYSYIPFKSLILIFLSWCYLKLTFTFLDYVMTNSSASFPIYLIEKQVPLRDRWVGKQESQLLDNCYFMAYFLAMKITLNFRHYFILSVLPFTLPE